MPMMLVGQVTKDSTVAGPRALEHIVDTTLSLDGDKHTSLRLLRTVKNRFGSLEVAAFEQTDSGMREVLDPSSLFREQRDVPGARHLRHRHHRGSPRAHGRDPVARGRGDQPQPAAGGVRASTPPAPRC